MGDEAQADPQPLKLKYTVTVKKFDGAAPKDGETKEPVETIIREHEETGPDAAFLASVFGLTR